NGLTDSPAGHQYPSVGDSRTASAPATWVNPRLKQPSPTTPRPKAGSSRAASWSYPAPRLYILRHGSATLGLIEVDVPPSSPSTASLTISSCSLWTRQLTLALKAQPEVIRSPRQWPSSTDTEALATGQSRSRFEA